MNSFNIKDLNFSVVNTELSDQESARDQGTPFSFLDFIQYLQTEYAPDKYSSLYTSYLKLWYKRQTDSKSDQKKLFKEYYKQFIQEIILTFTTETEKSFLQKINYDDAHDLDIAIPFYANKLTEVATFYKSKREEGKYVITKNKIKGSVTGIERAIFDNIYNYVINSEDVLLTYGSSLSSITRDFGISLQDYVDVYGDYFDLSNDKGEQALRKQLFNDNSIKIDTDYFFDPDALKVLKSNSFIRPIKNFKITPPELSQQDISSVCTPDDSFLDELNDVYTKGGLTLAEVYKLKRQFITKYISSDFYYIDTTGTSPVSGLLFQADAPTNNLLNIQSSDIAAVASNEQVMLRDVGLFFKPDDIGLFKLNSVKSSFELDTTSLETDNIYIFPDPDVYGNVGVNSLSSYPFLFTFDFRDNIRNVSSSVAYGDPKITNKNLTFEPYSTKQRETQELNTLNSLGYNLNFSDLYNSGVIRKISYDCFGNEYALFKPERLEDRQRVSQDTVLSVLLDGHTFYDDVFNEGFDFNYDTAECRFKTIRSGLETSTNSFTALDTESPYYLFFRNFLPYEDLRGERSCSVEDSGGFDETQEVDQKIISFKDGGDFTQSDGTALPDPVKTDDPRYPSSDNYYYQTFVNCKTYNDDIRDFYVCGRFADRFKYEQPTDNTASIQFFNEIFDENKTALQENNSVSGANTNVGRLLEAGNLYVKDQGTGLSQPITNALSTTLSKYSKEVINDITVNLIDFDIINDSIILETPSTLLIDKIGYESGAFMKPNTSNTLVSVNSADNLSVCSNRLLINKIDTPTSGGAILFAVFKTLKTDIATGVSLPPNYWYVYPEIYQYDIADNNIVKIFPENVKQVDLVSFRTSFGTVSANFTPEKIKTPKLAYNSMHNKLKLSYVLLDQNNLTHLHDCLFEWRSGVLTLNNVTRFYDKEVVLRTTSFTPSTTFTTLCTSPIAAFTNFDINQNQLCIL